MYSLLKTLDRQGILKGDLNVVQRISLHWLMNKEIEERVAIKRTDLENLAMATNPNTQNPFLRELLKKYTAEEEEMEEIDWTTPQTEEDMAELTRLMQEDYTDRPTP